MRADGLYTQTLQIPNLIKSSLKRMLALRVWGGGGWVTTVHWCLCNLALDSGLLTISIVILKL